MVATGRFVSRMQAVQSPIIPIVGELIRKNPGTISLGQGVVSYGPPPEVARSIANFLADADLNKYREVQGIPELRTAIARKLAAENAIRLDGIHQVVVTAGSNMGFVNALLAITQPGDEIVLQVPYYFNHEMAIAMASCKAVLVPTDRNYQLQVEAIEAAITDRTRAIVTISPNNPTGAVYPSEALWAVNQLCQARGIYHISDEAYEYFTYDGAVHVSPAQFDPGSQHTISLFSLSKAYGFASWRIGYMAIPARLLESVQKIQDTILICPPVISQYAALGALTAGRAYCAEKIKAIATTRLSILEAIASLESVCTMPEAEGAFYGLLALGTSMPAMTLVERLIRDHGVAVIPGTTFGMNEGCYLRVAYAALEPETVKEGCDRLVSGLKSIL
ncbi:pyridoxal phosphate-dependent aminotransferase [Altericista sp. CCNU0014]|uniref:pyridoxal phosphate-dependent aminotransferase n=1 Tax=Altericista sp. CCNU0014 TaxID=3082949 RepID=UPI00384F9D5A